MSTRVPAPAHWWALLAGNFAIGCGVMVVPGALNDIVRSLAVSVPVGGQLVAVSAAVVCVGAPLAAIGVDRFDRRRFLTLTLVWYALGHLLAAFVPDFAWLLPVRTLGMLAAAAFTPQAAASLAAMSEPAQRGRAITFIFLGWSLASVLGMPMHSFIAETVGWRAAFAMVALLSVLAAWAVWRTMPDGVRPPPLALAQWRRTLSHPALMVIVLVTACSAAGQFSVFSYLAPYFSRELGAGAAGISLLFLWFGAFGLAGNLLLTRWIDRLGASRSVAFGLLAIAGTMAAWPLAGSVVGMAVVLVPWALGCFSSNSAQQARLGAAAPAVAGVLMALNTTAMYLGQAVGASSGGVLIAAAGFELLPRVAVAWLLLALALSLWSSRRLARQPADEG